MWQLGALVDAGRADGAGHGALRIRCVVAALTLAEVWSPGRAGCRLKSVALGVGLWSYSPESIVSPRVPKA